MARGILSEIFGDSFGEQMLRTDQTRRNAFQAGFKKGIVAAAHIARREGQIELAERISKLQLVRKT